VNVGGAAGGGTVVGGTLYVDNAAGDLNPAAGEILLVLGGVNFNISTFGGSSASPVASLATTANGTVSPAAPTPFVLNLFITDTGFSIPPTPLFLSQTVNVGGVANGPAATIEGVGYFGQNNSAFELGTVFTDTAVSAVNSGSVTPTGPTNSPYATDPGPYSLTSHIRLTVTNVGSVNPGTLQFNSNLTASAVPEPSSVALFGSVLLATGFSLRRKFGKS
jgi:hypothetical protein